MIRKGEQWGSAASGPPDLEVRGDDAALARSVVRSSPVPLVAYRPTPDADLARAVGLAPDAPDAPDASRATELVLDALEVATGEGAARIAVNAVTIGTPPDRLTRWSRRGPFEVMISDRSVWSGRATGVVVANGQFIRGADIVPRGHPGDGRAEIQVYAPGPGERAEMRRRLATGTHVPHPRILERTGRVVEITTTTPVPVEIDGIAAEPSTRIRVTVLPGALRILV